MRRKGWNAEFSLRLDVAGGDYLICGDDGGDIFVAATYVDSDFDPNVDINVHPDDFGVV